MVATGRMHAVRICITLFALALTACAPAPIIKTVEVPVTKYVKQQIAPGLLKPCVYAEPDKACWRGTTRDWCNGQIVQMLVEYRAALATCNSQIQSIKQAQQ